MKKGIIKLLTILCLLTVGNTGLITIAETQNATHRIEKFTTVLTEDSDTWIADTNESGHLFKYTTTFAVSGSSSLDIGSVEMTFPTSILKKRDGTVGDKFSMSIPSKEEVLQAKELGQEVDSTWQYEIQEDGLAHVTNIKRIKSGSTFNIEYGYIMTDKVSSYKDMTKSDNIVASITVNTESGVLDSTSEGKGVTIDTNVQLHNSKIELTQGSVLKAWDKSWGEEPEDVNDYYYSLYKVSSYITGNQPYNYTLKATGRDSVNNVNIQSYRYNIGNNGWSDKDTEENSTNFCEDGKPRTDLILFRIPKNKYKNKSEYTIKLTQTAKVENVDKIDNQPEPITSETDLHYYRPEFIAPNGSFGSIIEGDERKRLYPDTSTSFSWNKVNTDVGEYSRYDLQAFKRNTLDTYDGIDFGIANYGYPGNFTVEKGKSASDKDNMYQKDVKYEQEVTSIQLLDNSKNIVEDNLTSEDYQIKSVSLDMEVGNAKYTELYNKYEQVTTKPSENDIINIYAKYNSTGDYVKVGEYNVGTKTFSNLADGIRTSKNKLFFDNNVTSYKLDTSNKHYMSTLLSGAEFELKHSTKVDNYIKDRNEIVVKASVTNRAYNYLGDKIAENTSSSYDYARETEMDSKIRKSVVQVRNNKLQKQYEITWNIDTVETARISTTEITNVNQKGGTWFDLLPSGLNYIEDSAVLKEKNSDKEYKVKVSTVPNYKNTGRTLLKITTEDEVKEPTLFFTTSFEYSAIKDYGGKLYNPVTFETGNKDITNGTADKCTNLSQFNEEMSGLTNDKGNRFIYSETVYNLKALVYSSSGLLKQVKNSVDSKYVSETFVTPNSDYSYRLRFANSPNTISKDLIMFDSLENYKVGNGVKSWTGILQSIDTTQIEKSNIAPVKYVSTEDVDLETLRGLSPEEMLSEFTKLDEYTGDYADIRTIAIDCRYRPNGSRVVLNKGQSVSAIINMKAPSNTNGGDLKIYNNIYAYNTTEDEVGNTYTSFIHQDYTILDYKVVASFNLHKVSSKDNTPISGITFRLTGKSDYGEDITRTRITDSKGNISFKNVPMGRYTLEETKTTPDYLLNDNKYDIVIDDTGKVTISGDVTNEVTITNEPRVHANVVFDKKVYPNSVGISAPIKDVTFMLIGKSDYGNDVQETAISNKQGKVEFKNIEKGIYDLYETDTPDKFLPTSDKYQVRIDENGFATLINLTTNSTDRVIYNGVKQAEIQFRKVDEETLEPLDNISFTIKGVAHDGTQVNKVVTTDKNGIIKEMIPVGTYTITENENPTTSEGIKYIQSSKKFTLEVKKDGSYTIDMEKIDDIYTAKNEKALADVFTVRKEWVGGNPDGFIPKIKIYTKLEDVK